MRSYGKTRSHWGKLKKGEATKLRRVATTGLVGGKEKKLKLPK